MRPIRRLYAASFLADFSLYLMMLALPFEAMRLGATPVILGLVPALYGSAYSATAILSGRLSDRWPRQRFARTGAVVATVSALLIARPESLVGLLAFVPGIGIGLGLFWAPLQAAIADAVEESELDGAVGRYNMSWSFGKGCGLLLGGLLYSRAGADGVFGIAAVALLLAGALLPAVPRREHPAVAMAPADSEPSVPLAVRSRFRKVAWVANGIAFGVGATINHQYPKLLVARGYDAEVFGSFLGGVFLLETVTFFVLGRRTGWRYRAGPLVGIHGAIALAVLVLAAVYRLPLLVPIAMVLGSCLGLAYMSSLYYSLHSPTDRGKHAGVHEAVLGTFSVVLPLAGGAAASLTGDLRAPYVLLALVLILAALVAWRQLQPTRAVVPH